MLQTSAGRVRGRSVRLAAVIDTSCMTDHGDRHPDSRARLHVALWTPTCDGGRLIFSFPFRDEPVSPLSATVRCGALAESHTARAASLGSRVRSESLTTQDA